jgi:carboxypeptidase family protein
MKKQNKKLLLLLFIFPLVFLAKANTGRTDAPLQGYVTDAVTKKPVQGVVVSASATSVNTSKEVTTDADGYFSFSQLPSSQVTLQFDKKGYQPVKKTGIVLKEKGPVKVNVEFLQEEVSESNDDSEYPLLRMLHMD